jgi:hypothetical protein
MTNSILLCSLIASTSLIHAFITDPVQTLIPSGRRQQMPTAFVPSTGCSVEQGTLWRSSRRSVSLSQSRFDESSEEENDPSFHRSASSSEHEQVEDTPQQRNITAIVEKKMRLSKAQDEIDRILNGPDPPFDMEQALQKVTSIAPPVTETLAEEELEQKFSQLEQDLYEAVKQQDYTKAAATKKEISQLQIDDFGAVLQVNAAFYRAFSKKDYDNMQSLWLKDGTSTCIHPSHKPLVGSKAVLTSWKKMFESADGSFQRNWMEPKEIRLTVKGASTAVVTCDEHVYARRFIRGKRRQTELINKLTATNIFRKVDGKWYLTYHHASWHADSEIAKQALRGSLAGASKNRQTIRKSPGKAGSEDGSIGMDGILGMDNFGPLLGGSSNTDEDEGKKPGKRIVMGSLSDILNGNLGDLLSNSSDDDDSEEGIISFTRMDDKDDEDDDDDDEIEIVSEEDDDDDDDDDDDEDEGTGSEAVSIMKQWAESTGQAQVTAAEASAANTKANNDSTSAPKDALRQDCISALRKLCDQGSISPKQKRVLLTDIITCSAKGEFSMVEVAYELLCGEGEDKDAAEEEFADQCRVFAHSLPESPGSSPSQQQ